MAGIHEVSCVRLEGEQVNPRLSATRKLKQALAVSVSDLIDLPQTKAGKSHGPDQRKDQVEFRIVCRGG